MREQVQRKCERKSAKAAKDAAQAQAVHGCLDRDGHDESGQPARAIHGDMLAGKPSGASVIPWFASPAVSLGFATLDLSLVFTVLGACATLVWAGRQARSAGLQARRVVDGLMLAMASGLVIGHGVDVIFYRPDDLHAGWRALLPWSGGLSSLGLLAGAGVAVLIVFRTDHGLAWDYLDRAAQPILLGIVLVRLGCFLGHDHAGQLTPFPAAVAYPGGARHDLGLDEALLVSGILAATVALRTRLARFRGGLCLASAAGYALLRFVLESLRGTDLHLLGRHSDRRWAGFTLVQIIALPAMLLFGRTWLRLRKQAVATGQALPDGQRGQARE